MPVLIQRERNNRWLDLAVVLTLVALITLDISIFLKPTNNPTPAEARAAELVEGWLREQKKGGDGLRFSGAWRTDRAGAIPRGSLVENDPCRAVRSRTCPGRFTHGRGRSGLEALEGQPWHGPRPCTLDYPHRRCWRSVAAHTPSGQGHGEPSHAADAPPERAGRGQARGALAKVARARERYRGEAIKTHRFSDPAETGHEPAD